MSGAALRREGNGTRSGKRAGKLGEDGQVCVKLDPFKPTDAQRSERPFILETTELALDGGAAGRAT